MTKIREKSIIIFRSGLIGDTIVAIPAIHEIKKNNTQNKIIYVSFKENKEHLEPINIIGSTKFVDLFLILRTYNKILLLIDLLTLIFYIISSKNCEVFHLETSEFNYKFKKKFFNFFGVKNFYFESTYINKKISIRLLNIVNQRYPISISSQKEELSFNAINDYFELKQSVEFNQKKIQFYIIAACTNFKSKLWDKDNYILIAKELYNRHNLIPVLYGSKNDFDYCEQIINELNFGYNFAGVFTISQSLFFLKNAKFYLGNDTGVMHMASMMNILCFTIFSSIEKDDKWLPYGNRHINFKTPIICEGCKLKVCINYDNLCIKSIQPSDVLNAINLYLES